MVLCYGTVTPSEIERTEFLVYCSVGKDEFLDHASNLALGGNSKSSRNRSQGVLPSIQFPMNFGRLSDLITKTVNCHLLHAHSHEQGNTKYSKVATRPAAR